MRNNTCLRCNHWNRVDDHRGECRRNPPNDSNDAVCQFPKTLPHIWCGEFSQKLDEQPLAWICPICKNGNPLSADYCTMCHKLRETSDAG